MSEEFDAIVQDVALKQGIQNPKLELESSSNKGDGYLGMIKFGKIVGSNKTLDVVLKCSHRKPKDFGDLIHDIYLNEINFYSKVAPTFAKFQNEYKIAEPFDNTAKFYGAIDEIHQETLVLGNLKVENYEMWDRKKLMNEGHLKSTLKTFAKFHGTSFAIQQLNPELYKAITYTMNHDVFHEILEKMKFLAQLKQIIKDLMVVFDPETEKAYIDKMEAVAATIHEDINEAFRYHENDVVLQGDCWCSNALYQYADKDHTEVPKSMKLLDFQLTKLGSPALDLSYFFYAAASKECFDKLDYFLKFYHDALAEHLEKFQLKVENVFSFEQFLEHWRRISKFGLIMTFGVRKVMFVESEDAPDFTDAPEDFINNLQLSPEAQALYHQQIKELMVHFIERKFI